LIRVGNEELGGHQLLEPCMSGFETPVDHSAHDVALGEHPTKPLTVEDCYDADIVGGHHPASVGDCRVALEHEEETVAHDVAESLHGAPPKESGSVAYSANEGIVPSKQPEQWVTRVGLRGRCTTSSATARANVD